jgi:transposase
LFTVRVLSSATEETTMSSIPTHLTPEQFAQHVEPHLSKAKRGFVSKIPLYKIFNYILYLLHTGCQWAKLPIDKQKDHPENKEIREISHWAVYHHFRKWSKDGSLEKVWKHSIPAIQKELDLSELNLDGSHTLAKKGGESVAYQVFHGSGPTPKG